MIENMPNLLSTILAECLPFIIKFGSVEVFVIIFLQEENFITTVEALLPAGVTNNLDKVKEAVKTVLEEHEKLKWVILKRC